MVNKNKNSVKQSVKQSVIVKVHIGDKKKKSRAGKRKPRRRGGVSTVHETNPYAQAYNPVYIQSGPPPPPPADEGLGSALLAAIKQMGTPAKPHEEVLHNPLMRSAGRAEPYHPTQFRAPVRVTAPSDYTASSDTEIPAAVPIGRFHFTKTDPDYSSFSESEVEKPFMDAGHYKPSATLHNWTRRGSRDSGVVSTNDMKGEIHTPIRPGFHPNIPSSTAVNYDADDDDDRTLFLDSDDDNRPRLSAAAGGGSAAAGGGAAEKPPTPRGETGRRLNKSGKERKIRSDAGKGRVKPYKPRK